MATGETSAEAREIARLRAENESLRSALKETAPYMLRSVRRIQGDIRSADASLSTNKARLERAEAYMALAQNNGGEQR